MEYIIPEKNYTKIGNEISFEKELRFMDIGLYDTLCRLANRDWDFSIAGLATLHADGKSSIASSLKRLEKHGYIKMEQERGVDGRFSRLKVTIYQESQHELNLIFEEPTAKKSSAIEPLSAKRVTDKMTQYNSNNISNNNNQYNNIKYNKLSDSEYNDLVDKYGFELVDSKIEWINQNNRKTCMTYQTIDKWCKKTMTLRNREFRKKNKFHNFAERNYDFEALEKTLLTTEVPIT